MTRAPDGPTGERADAARNRARLLEVAARLVAERGAEHVTMHEVAEAAGVGKGTLFRRFGDRDGLLIALLAEAEAEFHEAYTSGPRRWGRAHPREIDWRRSAALSSSATPRTRTRAPPWDAGCRMHADTRRTRPAPYTATYQCSFGKRELTVTTTCSPTPCSLS